MKQRIFYLDFLRSFAIIMVLVLHSISPYISTADLFGTTSWYINIILNAFARTGVPIFLMISGYLLLSSDKCKDFKGFYKKSFIHIGIPLVFWNIAYYIAKCVAGNIDFKITNLLADFINCGTEYHLWYLYTLIGIYLIAPFLKILIENCNTKQLCWLLILMMFCTTIRPFINTITPVYIYLFDPLFNGYISCFLMGYILGNFKYNRKSIIAFSSVGLICFLISTIGHNLVSSTEKIDLIFNYGYSLCHYGLAACIFVMAKIFLEKRAMFEKCITSLSKLSFGIYLIHVMVMDVVFNYFMIDASPIISSAYIFFSTFLVSYLISFLLSKIKGINRIVLG